MKTTQENIVFIGTKITVSENCIRYLKIINEQIGIIDNTDDIIIESDHIHRQDDDRQTTSEVQEWAIELIRRYLRETETLFENKVILIITCLILIYHLFRIINHSRNQNVLDH